MKIWLDDQWAEPDMPARHPPTGYTPTHSVIQAARWIREEVVQHISFDHDLGGSSTGYTLARLIEKWAFEKKIPRMTWEIHSANPVGRENITKAMESAERFWSNR